MQQGYKLVVLHDGYQLHNGPTIIASEGPLDAFNIDLGQLVAGMMRCYGSTPMAIIFESERLRAKLLHTLNHELLGHIPVGLLTDEVTHIKTAATVAGVIHILIHVVSMDLIVVKPDTGRSGPIYCHEIKQLQQLLRGMAVKRTHIIHIETSNLITQRQLSALCCVGPEKAFLHFQTTHYMVAYSQLATSLLTQLSDYYSASDRRIDIRENYSVLDQLTVSMLYNSVYSIRQYMQLLPVQMQEQYDRYFIQALHNGNDTDSPIQRPGTTKYTHKVVIYKNKQVDLLYHDQSVGMFRFQQSYRLSEVEQVRHVLGGQYKSGAIIVFKYMPQRALGQLIRDHFGCPLVIDIGLYDRTIGRCKSQLVERRELNLRTSLQCYREVFQVLQTCSFDIECMMSKL